MVDGEEGGLQAHGRNEDAGTGRETAQFFAARVVRSRRA
jgi:hypothetical protein